MTFIEELELFITPPEKALTLDNTRLESNPDSCVFTTPSPGLALLYHKNVLSHAPTDETFLSVGEKSNGRMDPSLFPLPEKLPKRSSAAIALDPNKKKTRKSAVVKVQPICIQYTEKEKRERKYECEHCKKRFSRPSSLTSHVYTHTGERPFACDFPECTKRFSVLSNLRRHYRVHANRRQRSGKKRLRGRPPSVSKQFLDVGRFGGLYLEHSNSNNSIETLNSFVASNGSTLGSAPNTNSIIGGSGHSNNINCNPLDMDYCTTLSAPVQMPLVPQMMFHSRNQEYMQSSYAPRFRATAAIQSFDDPLASMYIPQTSAERTLDAATDTDLFTSSKPQEPYTEMSALYNNKTPLPPAQVDCQQHITTLPRPKDHLLLLSSLATGSDRLSDNTTHLSVASRAGCEAGIAATPFESLLNSASVEHGRSNDIISGIGSISSCSSSTSTSSNDGRGNDLLSAGIWPIPTECAETISKELGPLETLTAAVTAVTNPFITSDLQKPAIVSSGIETNTFVTAKAMNAGISVLPESSLFDDNKMNHVFPPLQQKQAVNESCLNQLAIQHNSQLSHADAQRCSAMPQLGTIGGMVLDHYAHESINSLRSALSDPLLQNTTKYRHG